MGGHKKPRRGAAEHPVDDQAALMKQKVDSPKPLDEAAEMQELKSLIKQRTEAAEMFRKGGCPEQAE
jgi:uncharacterized protein